jgi:hypothetical protein
MNYEQGRPFSLAALVGHAERQRIRSGAFPRVRGNQKGASPACGGIKGGTGVALMVTLGFGPAGVEMLRSAQHDRLVLCTMLMNAAV